MVFCKACGLKVIGVEDGSGFLSCSRCGKVIRHENFSTETTFVKTASGKSQAVGSVVRSIEGESFSRERLYERAREDLRNLKNGLGMGENNAIVDKAMEFYRIAVERNFTKGRRTEQVQAACLYIACRETRRPYLLIDFSNYLSTNVYVLGAVYLQLCKVLHLTEHQVCQQLLDPSIFIHKYTASLTGGKNKDISDTALTIIASMNRDWMQTGRRPSGLWGAALYIAALSHGFSCSKSDILRLVHLCEATLSKRLVEFENTESGSLTIDELTTKAEELKETTTHQSYFQFTASSKELLCQHKGTSRPPFGFGLCKDCYAYFIGFDGGSDPPAFQRAEKKRMREASTEEANRFGLTEKEMNYSRKDEELQPTEPEIGGAASLGGNDTDKLNGADDISTKTIDESDNFSDIDDDEVDGYLHNKEEADKKKYIWEEMNREYLEEQAAKEAAARKSREANLKDLPEDMQAAKELNAAVSAAVAKSKKEKQLKRAAEARNLHPAQTASEAAGRMLAKRKLSSKINYEALERLFDEAGLSQKAKKLREELHPDDDHSLPTANGLGTIYENEEEGDGGDAIYDNNYDEENMNGTYDYNNYDDYGDERFDDY